MKAKNEALNQMRAQLQGTQEDHEFDFSEERVDGNNLLHP